MFYLFHQGRHFFLGDTQGVNHTQATVLKYPVSFLILLIQR